MPIYEYECSECKTVFEVIVSSSTGAEDIVCSKCGSNNITKIISAGSHKLKSGTALPSMPSGAGCGGSSRFS